MASPEEHRRIKERKQQRFAKGIRGIAGKPVPGTRAKPKTGKNWITLEIETVGEE